jgi:putative ABC transport system permease protein
MDMVQLRVIVVNMFEQGLLFTFLSFGVLLTFRFFRFPDLTAEGSYPLGGAVVATLLVAGLSPFVAIGVAVAAGVIAGIITALIHTKLKINPIIAGIITMTANYSIMLRIMGRANIPLLSVDTVFQVALSPVEAALGHRLIQTEKSIATIGFLAILVAVVSVLFWWFLRTDLGLAVRATGENEAMIRSLGVNTDNTKIVGVSISNGLIALSGALVAQNHGFADVGMGIGVLVAGAAAVLIGESIFGDRTVGWWIVASIVGMLIYRLLVALALRVGLRPTDLKVITAILLLLALSMPKLRIQLSR